MTDPIAPLRPDAALFLDFDGTLAPIGNDPDAVQLPSGGVRVLTDLAAMLNGALVIISGRDIHDLAARTPVGVWRVGGHGLDACKPGTMPKRDLDQTGELRAPQTLRDGLERLAAQHSGVRIEDKARVLAVHYRAAPALGDALAEAVADLVAAVDGYTMQHGKMVIEAKPQIANKGVALDAMMARPEFAGRTPVMAGDDVTDEDAMAAALRAGGFAIKVGDGTTIAPMRVQTPDDIWNWLKRSVSL